MSDYTPEILDELDSSFAVDDQQQEEIDKLKGDPWVLQPGRDGFVPLDLVQDAPKDSPRYKEGYRSVWSQDEVVEVEKAGFRPLTNRENRDLIEGQIAFIQFKAVRGPNEGKRIELNWWLRNGDRDAVRDMNAQLQEIYGRLNIEPVLKTMSDGRQLPSYTAALPTLEGRNVRIRISQKWDYPYKQQPDGSWLAQTDEPMKFKKRIVEVKAL